MSLLYFGKNKCIGMFHACKACVNLDLIPQVRDETCKVWEVMPKKGWFRSFVAEGKTITAVWSNWKLCVSWTLRLFYRQRQSEWPWREERRLAMAVIAEWGSVYVDMEWMRKKVQVMETFQFIFFCSCIHKMVVQLGSLCFGTCLEYNMVFINPKQSK